ncbi:MAG: type II toxin-antitoxin system RelE/ParE family toxin [Neisseriaceae bacterium]|nr:type II toxin-antitoxin system RelE/ParE family toxin [Neisseriaceae bacterium]
MSHLIITPDAQDDILRFYRFYLETADEKVAWAVVDTIEEQLNKLAQNPKIGRIYFDEITQNDYREFLIFFGKAQRNCYIALYKYDGETVRILRIKNARESGYRPISNID